MNTDPEAIAREILRLAADRTAAEPQGDFLDYMVALRKTAPALAAAYLDLRATSTEALEAERIRCTRQADRDAARRDAAYLDLRAQLDAVTAQRDELREAGRAVMHLGPAPSDLRILLRPSADDIDGYDRARGRLAKALEAAR